MPGLGRSPGGGHDNPLQYSCLENSMDCIVHGVSKSRTRLSSFQVHFSISCEKPRDFCLMLLVLLTASVAFLFLIFKPLKLWRQSVVHINTSRFLLVLFLLPRMTPPHPFLLANSCPRISYWIELLLPLILHST